ncbi:hypothetical protein IMSAGC014_00786 [Bacteroidaceae bacterium]|nr:hypothetical protein IMSAGC014_00786 [Bacteroidaceae bacterium]
MNSARWGIVMTGLFLCALFGNAQARLIIEKPVQNSSDSILLSNTTKPSTDEVKKKQFDLGGQWSADTLRPNHNTPADTAHLTLINDSLLKVNQKTLNLKSRFSPDPKRALWLSLVFPGAGQIYNRKYWKLPIIYGGFLGCTYALMWNQQMYRDYSQAYLDIMDDDPNTNSYLDMLPPRFDITGREEQFKKIFKRKKDFYRRNRDLSAFCFIGVYLLSVIDAYVDAQLSEFDITPDLSMRLEPAVIQNKSIGTSGSNNSYGVGCSFKF